MHKIKYLFISVFVFMLSIFFIPNVNALVEDDIEYKTYADASGVIWQYFYNDDTNEEVTEITESWIEVSFFSKPDGVSSVTVPSMATLKAQDSTLPDADKLIVGEYIDEDTIGERPVMATPITQISLVNVNYIKSIYPMIDRTSEDYTKVVLSSTGTVVGAGSLSQYYLDIVNLEHVVAIETGGFYKSTLKNTNLSLDSLLAIGDHAFQNTNVTTVSINVENVNYNAFRECKDLTDVTLGNKVKIINDAAFRDDVKLVNINYNNVTYVGNFAFAGCTSYNIPINNTKLTYIGDAAYKDDTAFTGDLIIPSGVTSIGWATFYKTSISSVNTNNVTLVGPEAFEECPNLADVNLSKTKTISYRAFYKDNKITELSLPDSTLDIQVQAFENCSIETIELNKVQKLDSRAFANNKLTELVLPHDLGVLVADGMFAGNDITKVTIEYDISTNMSGIIFKDLFYDSYSYTHDSDKIKEIVIVAPYKVNQDPIVNSEFGTVHVIESAYGVIIVDSMDLADGYGNERKYKNVIRSNYFYGLPNVEKFIVGEGYEFIGSQAFYDNIGYGKENPVEIQLPTTLKGIGSEAFYKLPKGSKINLPQSLEYIGSQAFLFAKGLTNDIDLRNLRVIGYNTFQGSCFGDVYLHDKLEYIGSQALFPGYASYSDKNPNSGERCATTKNFIVDTDLYGIYKGYGHSFFTYFDTFGEYELIKFTDKAVTEPNFGSDWMETITAKKIDLGETPWKQIGTSSFLKAKIGELILPKNLETIGINAFEYSTIEKEVKLPSTLKRIDTRAFLEANLKTTQLPVGLEYIGSGAFYGMVFNSNPVIPKTVTYIGSSAFVSKINYNYGVGTTASVNEYESFTFDCNLPMSVTQSQSIHQFMWGSKIGKLILTENVKELPSNNLSSDELTFDEGTAMHDIDGAYVNRMDSYTNYDEFYGLDLNEVEIRGVEVIPPKAFIHNNLKKLDLSKDTNLKSIGDGAFLHATELEKVILPNNKDQEIKLGYQAFSDTGFKTLGTSDSDSMRLDGAKFTTNYRVFEDNNKLTSVTIPNGFNDNVIKAYTFAECDELKEVSVLDKITDIKEYAFMNDNKLEKIFIWGNTKIHEESNIELAEVKFDKTKKIVLYVPLYGPFFNEDSYIKIKQNGNVLLSKEFEKDEISMPFGYKNYINNKQGIGYKYASTLYDGNGGITIETSDNLIVSIFESATEYEVHIYDLTSGQFTIPATTDIYGYSNHNSFIYDKDLEKYRQNKVMNTKGEFLPLDEVIYLTSNHPKVNLTDNKTNFDKTNLIVYALRRDGLIMETANCGNYEGKKYALEEAPKKVVFEEYDKKTEDKYEIVYQAPIEAKDMDTSTENFENMTFEIVPDNKILGTYKVELYYENDFIETEVSTSVDTKMNLLNPKTGDNITIYFIVFGVSIAAIVVGLIVYKKKKNN